MEQPECHSCRECRTEPSTDRNGRCGDSRKNKKVTIGVLGNDSDPDGDSFTLTSFTQSANGTVVRNANNTFTFTPVKNFVGTATFIYTIADSYGATATGTVTVTVTK